MQQDEALQLMKLGRNIFLTGAAGSGKTYILKRYISHLRSRNIGIGITASTGIAASHLNGTSIHSWSGIGIRQSLTDADREKILKDSRRRKRFASASVLIIDEISMLHAFQLDMVDEICRMFKVPSEPFGGMQVILCGDLFQLPPISTDDTPVRFVNESKAWNNMDLQICYLEKQFRQNDNELITILNDIRNCNTGEHTLVPLRKRYRAIIPGKTTPTKLYTHNADTDRINNDELGKLKTETCSFKMMSTGLPHLVEGLKKNCLAPEILHLKKGAMVMCVKNNFEDGYVNGTLGTIIDFDDECPVIETNKGKKITLSREKWSFMEGEIEVASIIQFPLRLAWAITVHKSQGMSLDMAETDLSQCFIPGMGYVALSRVSSLEGLRLMGLNKLALQVDPKISRFDKELQNLSREAVLVLKSTPASELEKTKKHLRPISSVKEMEKKPARSGTTLIATKEFLLKKEPLEKIAEKRNITVGTIVSHVEKLKKMEPNLDLSYLKPEPTTFSTIAASFEEHGAERLAPVREALENKFTYDELRLARLFLDVNITPKKKPGGKSDIPRTSDIPF